jgi:hypothetical protein
MKDKDFEMASMSGDDIPNISMVHELKTLPEHFENVLSGRKRFEIRLNDRQFSIGDVLILREYNPDVVGCEYTGRNLKVTVTFLLQDCPQFGLIEGHCIMGIEFEKSWTLEALASMYYQKSQNLAGNALMNMEAMSFGETLKFCTECEQYYQPEEMACEGICIDCASAHDAKWMKHEN